MASPTFRSGSFRRAGAAATSPPDASLSIGAPDGTPSGVEDTRSPRAEARSDAETGGSVSSPRRPARPPTSSFTTERLLAGLSSPRELPRPPGTAASAASGDTAGRPRTRTTGSADEDVGWEQFPEITMDDVAYLERQPKGPLHKMEWDRSHAADSKRVAKNAGGRVLPGAEGRASHSKRRLSVAVGQIMLIQRTLDRMKGMARRGNIETVRTTDAAPKPYHEQGNPEMYTIEKILKRQNLKRSAAIRACVDKFWRVLASSWRKRVRVFKPAYFRATAVFAKLLIPKATIKEALEAAEQDWARDAKDHVGLDEEEFFDALFELADTWCEGVEESEYVRFLDMLFERSTEPVSLEKQTPAQRAGKVPARRLREFRSARFVGQATLDTYHNDDRGHVVGKRDRALGERRLSAAHIHAVLGTHDFVREDEEEGSDAGDARNGDSAATHSAKQRSADSHAREDADWIRGGGEGVEGGGTGSDRHNDHGERAAGEWGADPEEEEGVESRALSRSSARRRGVGASGEGVSMDDGEYWESMLPPSMGLGEGDERDRILRGSVDSDSIDGSTPGGGGGGGGGGGSGSGRGVARGSSRASGASPSLFVETTHPADRKSSGSSGASVSLEDGLADELAVSLAAARSPLVQPLPRASSGTAADASHARRGGVPVFNGGSEEIVEDGSAPLDVTGWSTQEAASEGAAMERTRVGAGAGVSPSLKPAASPSSPQLRAQSSVLSSSSKTSLSSSTLSRNSAPRPPSTTPTLPPSFPSSSSSSSSPMHSSFASSPSSPSLTPFTSGASGGQTGFQGFVVAEDGGGRSGSSASANEDPIAASLRGRIVHVPWHPHEQAGSRRAVPGSRFPPSALIGIDAPLRPAPTPSPPPSTSGSPVHSSASPSVPSPATSVSSASPSLASSPPGASRTGHGGGSPRGPQVPTVAQHAPGSSPRQWRSSYRIAGHRATDATAGAAVSENGKPASGASSAGRSSPASEGGARVSPVAPSPPPAALFAASGAPHFDDAGAGPAGGMVSVADPDGEERAWPMGSGWRAIAAGGNESATVSPGAETWSDWDAGLADRDRGVRGGGWRSTQMHPRDRAGTFGGDTLSVAAARETLPGATPPSTNHTMMPSSLFFLGLPAHPPADGRSTMTSPHAHLAPSSRPRASTLGLTPSPRSPRGPAAGSPRGSPRGRDSSGASPSSPRASPGSTGTVSRLAHLRAQMRDATRISSLTEADAMSALPQAALRATRWEGVPAAQTLPTGVDPTIERTDYDPTPPGFAFFRVSRSLEPGGSKTSAPPLVAAVPPSPVVVGATMTGAGSPLGSPATVSPRARMASVPISPDTFSSSAYGDDLGDGLETRRGEVARRVAAGATVRVEGGGRWEVEPVVSSPEVGLGRIARLAQPRGAGHGLGGSVAGTSGASGASGGGGASVSNGSPRGGLPMVGADGLPSPRLLGALWTDATHTTGGVNTLGLTHMVAAPEALSRAGRVHYDTFRGSQVSPALERRRRLATEKSGPSA